MIVFVNGAFGVGKTTVANLLQAQLPNSMIYDPEIVGGMLRFMTKGILPAAEDTDDFQDIALWPTLTVEIANHMRRHYQRHLIVPMTITHLPYFVTITEGLRQIDADFHHFCLRAKRKTIHQRLLARGETPGTWVFQQLERCVTAFQTDHFQTYLETDTVSSNEVVVSILQHI